MSSGFTGLCGNPTDQVTVLNAVIALLQAGVPKLAGPNTCFLSMDTEPLGNQRQNIYGTVCPMGGSYDGELFDGGAEAVEHSGVIVTVFSAMKLDRADADVAMLTDASRGLLGLKQQVLKSLVGKMLVDQSSNNILLRPMRPLQADHPNRHNDTKGKFSLMFETIFQWNLN